MTITEAMRSMHESTAEHFLYFGLGISLALIVVLVFAIGIIIGKKLQERQIK